MDIKPINNKRIYQSIIEQFIEFVKNGDLKKGEKLPAERQLAQMFNVSRASIREAFTALEIIGLIEIRPGEGSFVTELNVSTFINTIFPLIIKDQSYENDLLDFRKMLEIEGIRIACDKQSNLDFSEMEASLTMMQNAMQNEDMEMGTMADVLFHKALFELSGNNVIKTALECTNYMLENSVKFNRLKILKDNNNNIDILYDQHVCMYNLIKEKQTCKAIEMMKKHLEFVKKMS